MKTHPDDWPEWAMSADPEMGWRLCAPDNRTLRVDLMDKYEMSFALVVWDSGAVDIDKSFDDQCSIGFKSPAHAIAWVEFTIRMLRGEEVPS